MASDAPELGAVIDALRRRRSTCIYCDRPPATWEHIVPEAVGGKLTAFVLCEVHRLIEADHRFAERFAPMTHLLQVQRQDGRVGAAMMLEKADGSGGRGYSTTGLMEIPTDVIKDDEGRFVRVIDEITRVPEDPQADRRAIGPTTWSLRRFPLVPETPEPRGGLWVRPSNVAQHREDSAALCGELRNGRRAAARTRRSTPSESFTGNHPSRTALPLRRSRDHTLRRGSTVRTRSHALRGTVTRRSRFRFSASFVAWYALTAFDVREHYATCNASRAKPPALTSEDLVYLPWRQANDEEQAQWLEGVRERVTALIDRRINVYYDKKVREALPKAYGEFSRHAFDHKSPIEGISVYLRAEHRADDS